MPKPKYEYPRLLSHENSYRMYFDTQFRMRELERAFVWNALEKRGSAFLWDQLGEVDKSFLEESTFVIVRRKDNREPFYYFYVDKKFWKHPTKVREDHEWIQSHANLHLDKLTGAINWKRGTIK